eukprot:TRINITY_DN4598_c0_g1_i1.p1 TRINITY_DN4598_c0_g1~~TRINITY_DN4598_c0_g1_i1.p1  ORF type:complete len:302 (+),score=37.31 TRINITY_DN4598_c0_g1_i1:113-1018(+)
MIRRPPRSTQGVSSAASDVYKRQVHGVIHRDLKPENIILSEVECDRNFKIIDFGFANFVEPDRKLWQYCGSPGFVAPEVLHRSGYDQSADIFSCGIILYILLCGSSPFIGKTAEKVLEANKNCHIEFPPETWSRVSPEAKKLVQEMTAKDPSLRPTAGCALNSPWFTGEFHLPIGLEISAKKNRELTEENQTLFSISKEFEGEVKFVYQRGERNIFLICTSFKLGTCQKCRLSDSPWPSGVSPIITFQNSRRFARALLIQKGWIGLAISPRGSTRRILSFNTLKKNTIETIVLKKPTKPNS